MFLPMVICSLITYFVQSAEGNVRDYTLGFRLAGVPLHYLDYLHKTFWPCSLGVLYPIVEKMPPAGAVLGASLLLGAASLGAALAWRRRPWLALGWFWFLGVLVPMIGIIQNFTNATADRFSYLPQVGLLICAAWGGGELAARWRVRPRVLAALAGVALAALAARTAHQIGFWQNDFTLWEHTVRVTRDNPFASFEYGMELAQRGRLDEAIEQFSRSVALKPQADNLTNLGNAYGSKGDFARAADAFERAIKVQPDYPMAHFNLAMLRYKQGDLEAARQHFESAARLEPGKPDAPLKLGTIYAARGDRARALDWLQTALELARKRGDEGMALKAQAMMAQMGGGAAGK
jgi:tetratricopeptide (TPR) repeat protein